MNLLFEPAVAQELKDGLPSLRRVVAHTVAKDHIVPALSASLEYVKYQTNTGGDGMMLSDHLNLMFRRSAHSILRGRA